MDHILYHIFKITLDIFLKKHNDNIDNPSVRIWKRIAFEIEAGYNLEF